MQLSRIEAKPDLSASSIVAYIHNYIISNAHYLGIHTEKNPLDFWVYREIIFDTMPDVIVEIGTYKGGSTLALAHVCDNVDHGKVIAVDIDHSIVADIVKDHRRIRWFEGDAIEQFDAVFKFIEPDETVMVIEDSAHTYEHTLNVLLKYSQLVTPGHYLICEDTNCHHGLPAGPYPGPYEAVERFLDIKYNEFEVDQTREAFFITFNPNGFLRRYSTKGLN